jgi:hypothetical protein
MAGHLISRDELLAAGALDVPPAWRKSLQAGLPKPKKNDPQRELFGDDEESQPSAEAEATEAEADEVDEDADDSD